MSKPLSISRTNEKTTTKCYEESNTANYYPRFNHFFVIYRFIAKAKKINYSVTEVDKLLDKIGNR